MNTDKENNMDDIPLSINTVETGSLNNNNNNNTNTIPLEDGNNDNTSSANIDVQMEDDEENSNNNNNNNNNNSNSNTNNNNNTNTSSGNTSSQGKQNQLVTKLQSIYRLIMKQENILQVRCANLSDPANNTNNSNIDIDSLWNIYKVNTYLVENYIDFLTTALSEGQLPQDLAIGKEIVEMYRIERRLWVYGCITFLDVLKNFINNNLDPTIWSQFIINVFINLSEMLVELPESYRQPWFERLGDLSRMAIALYPRGFIDWKLSSEYWYKRAILHNIGHGKLYYHISTVEQNTLQAYVHLGKSVFCKDMFIPSQHYMQLVIDNIYQRAYSEYQLAEGNVPLLDHYYKQYAEYKSGYNLLHFPDGTIMNPEQLKRGLMTHFFTNHHYQHYVFISHIVEYLKHVEVISMPTFNTNKDLQQIVLDYFENSFGEWKKTTSSLFPKDNSNFFDEKYIFLQDSEKIKFYFSTGSLFAQSHILQLVGFGNPINPFAILFGLPTKLKEKKNKREKKTANSNSSSNVGQSTTDDNSVSNGPSINTATTSPEFDEDLPVSYGEAAKQLSLVTAYCAKSVLLKYLSGPLLPALPHLLTYGYFFSAVHTQIESLKHSKFVIDNNNNNGDDDDDMPVEPQSAIFDDGIANDDVKWWEEYMKSLFPWDKVVDFLNVLILFSLKNCPEKYAALINENKCANLNGGSVTDLPEVMGLVGTLWFDCLELDVTCDGYEDTDYGLEFDKIVESGEGFWMRCVELLKVFFNLAQNNAFGLRLCETSHAGLGSHLFQYEHSQLVRNNSDDISLIIQYYNVNIVKLAGSKGFIVDFKDFTGFGDRTTGCIYTSGSLERLNIQGGDDLDFENRYFEHFDQIEVELFQRYIKQAELNLGGSFFILDATSWLRHSGRIFKIMASKLVKLGICLTTFQELRFLRKSKDPTVSDAATRAVIILRHLYEQGKILPLRFTGNLATTIEEHLEYETKMTWKTHVDEFVIDAIHKNDKRLLSMEKENSVQESGDENNVEQKDETKTREIFLVSDDVPMRDKAARCNITSISSRFMFMLCNELGENKSTN